MANRPVILTIYSHQDELEKNWLLQHLYLLKASGLAELGSLSDIQINAHVDWSTAIAQEMAKAKIILLLITPNALAEEFLLREEMPILMQNCRTEGGIIIPVIAKPCAWQLVDWIARVLVRPRSRRPIWGDKRSEADAELASIAEELATILQRAENSSSSRASARFESQ